MSETTPQTAIAKAPAPAQQQRAMAIGPQGAEIRDSKDLWTLAKIMTAGMKGTDAPAEKDIYSTAVMIQAGREVGLTPVMSLRALYAINGRPAWMLEGLTGVMRQRGVIPADDADAWTVHYFDLPPDGTPIKDWPNTARCTVRLRRASWTKHVEATFSVGDAKLAGLWGKGGPWSNYPKRQLYARCGGFLARDFCSDVTLGLPVVEEARDIAEIHAPERAGYVEAPKVDASAPDPLDRLIAGEIVDAEMADEAQETQAQPRPEALQSAIQQPQEAPVEREWSAAEAQAAILAEASRRTDGDPVAAQDLAREVTGGIAKVKTREAAVEAHAKLAAHPRFGDA